MSAEVFHYLREQLELGGSEIIVENGELLPVPAQKQASAIPTKEIVPAEKKQLPSPAKPLTPRSDSLTSTASLIGLDAIDRLEDLLTFSEKLPFYSGVASSLLLGGQGPQQSSLLLLVESPSAEDVTTRSLFSGKEGELLNKMIHAIGLEFNLCYRSAFCKQDRGNKRLFPRDRNFLDKILEKELSFLQTSAIIVFGADLCRFFGGAAADPFKSPPVLSSVHSLPALNLPHPSELMENTSLKSHAWIGLQLLRDEVLFKGKHA